MWGLNGNYHERLLKWLSFHNNIHASGQSVWDSFVKQTAAGKCINILKTKILKAY